MQILLLQLLPSDLSSPWLSDSDHNFRWALGIVLGCWPRLSSSLLLPETLSCSLKCFPLNREMQDIGGKIKSPHFPALNQTKTFFHPHLLSQLNNKNNLPISPHTETFRFFIKSRGKIPQNFSSPPGINCRNSFRIICCYFLWNHWMNQMRSEGVGYFLYQKHATNKDKKALLLSRAALVSQNHQHFWAKSYFLLLRETGRLKKRIR